MEVLATNKAKNELHYEKTHGPHDCLLSIIFCIFLMSMSCYMIFKQEETKWIISMLSLTLLSVLAVLYNLEIYLLNKRAIETVSIQHEILVVEYRNLIFRHRKEIPLSAINGVEYCVYENRNVWYPYTLRVLHSGSQCYRIGISMTQEETKALARKISDLALQYV